MIILLQGAMDEEVDLFVEHYKPAETATVAGYGFRIADYNGNTIIVSQTEMGIINASVATAVGVMRFKPDLVINQGCAGAHEERLGIGDIIIGESSVYINDFKTVTTGAGGGSNSLSWIPGKRSYRVESAPQYVKTAESVSYGGRKYTGVLGSGDLFSKEVDRINYLHSVFGEACEDMESVASLKACRSFGVDGLALRIISNNELTGSEFDYGTCATLQKFVIKLVDEITEP